MRELLAVRPEQKVAITVERGASEDERRTVSFQVKPDPAWRPHESTEFIGLDPRWGILPATVFVDSVVETLTLDE